eukprot:350383-Chlamydomonas_euryale.AAC.8
MECIWEVCVGTSCLAVVLFSTHGPLPLPCEHPCKRPAASISDEQSPTGGLGGVLNGMEQRLAVRQRASKMSSGAPRGSHPATKSLSEK